MIKTASIIFGLLILILGLSCEDQQTKLIKHPNVLFIAIDDLNDWSEVLAGHSQSLTPNFKAFAERSVNFTKNYCASPGCNPSRSAILTGLHTYNSGMYSNYQDWRTVPKFKDIPTLPKHFRNNGYYTAGAGKIFHYSQVDSVAWDNYFPSQKQNMPDDYMPSDRPVNMPPFKYMYNMFDWAGLDIGIEETGDYKSVSFIVEELKKEHDKPFFLACGIYRPHLPWYVPQEYFDKFPLDSIELPKIIENDFDDLGNRAKELASRGGNYHHHVLAAGKWKEAVQAYLASVAYADEMFGLLIKALDESMHSENTIVVLWSDHGWQLGEKQHWRKFALWENVIRTLMMIRVPEGTMSLPQGSNNGNATNYLTSLLDIYPTLNSLCNLEGRQDLDGRNLMDVLSNPEIEGDHSIITTYDYGDYSIRKENWHYIQYIDDSKELYDLVQDSEEWYNLANDVEYESIVKMMQKEIPKNRVPLPEVSLIELMEHHIPPVKSDSFYFSEERKEWMERFKIDEKN
jgi:arylsulfatase A-like enzyme